MPELNTNIHVDGRWYGPAYGNAKVPAKIAKLITAPDVWVEKTEPAPVEEPPPAPEPQVPVVDDVAALLGHLDPAPPDPGPQSDAPAASPADPLVKPNQAILTDDLVLEYLGRSTASDIQHAVAEWPEDDRAHYAAVLAAAERTMPSPRPGLLEALDTAAKA